MTVPLIGREARALVARDVDAIAPEELPLWERARSLTILRRECDSWTRLAAGVAAWLAAVMGVAALATVVSHDAPWWLRVAALLAGALVLGFAVPTGLAAWRAGRRVVDAYCWWTLLPERMPGGGAGVEQWRADPLRDAVEARTFVFEGARVVRIGASAVSALAPLTFLDVLDRGPRPTWWDGETLALTLFSIGFVAIGLGTAAVVIWGQFRAARAATERDPVQRWLLRRR